MARRRHDGKNCAKQILWKELRKKNTTKLRRRGTIGAGQRRSEHAVRVEANEIFEIAFSLRRFRSRLASVCDATC